LMQKDYDSSIMQLKEALSLGLEDIDIYLALGKAYREKGDFEQSVNTLNIALKSVPEKIGF